MTDTRLQRTEIVHLPLPGSRAQLHDALDQLLKEVIAAGFESATDHNWPKAIKDAKAALDDYVHFEAIYDR